MDSIGYCNDLMVRMEELFYHEMSDCAPFKVELVGVDFIQSRDIKGDTLDEVIESCLQEIKKAEFVKDISYSISGLGLKFDLVIRDCIHIPKEAKLRKNGVKPYVCPIANMVLDQLIEKLGYEATYLANMEVDEQGGECKVRSAIYKTEDDIGKVCNWNEE